MRIRRQVVVLVNPGRVTQARMDSLYRKVGRLQDAVIAARGRYSDWATPPKTKGVRAAMAKVSKAAAAHQSASRQFMAQNPGRKPVSEITDRAKRYRAHHPDVRPAPPKRCGFCGSGRNVVPHHITGNEAQGDTQDLMWACKSCNTRVGALMRRAGLGKPTNQYNPARIRRGSKRELMAAYGAAINVMRGKFEGNVPKAVATIRATPAEIRSAYTARSWPVRKQIYGPSGRQGSLFGGGDVPF